jgi:hypothetical protein
LTRPPVGPARCGKAPLPALLLGLVGVLAWGCTDPPHRELAAAQDALEEARRQGADRYAPERWQEAEAALAQARQRIEAKDYRGALSSAIDAFDRARQAAQAAAAARSSSRSTALAAQAEVEASLREAAEVRQAARLEKVPDAAFEGVDETMAEVRAGLTTVAEALERDDPLTAERAASDLKTLARPLAQSVREARSQWEERRARRRGGRRR